MSKCYFEALNSTGTMVEVPLGEGSYTLFSYGVPVAVVTDSGHGVITLEKHSKTTSKHIRLWNKLKRVDGSKMIPTSQEAVEWLAEGKVSKFLNLYPDSTDLRNSFNV